MFSRLMRHRKAPSGSGPGATTPASGGYTHVSAAMQGFTAPELPSESSLHALFSDGSDPVFHFFFFLMDATVALYFLRAR